MAAFYLTTLLQVSAVFLVTALATRGNPSAMTSSRGTHLREDDVQDSLASARLKIRRTASATTSVENTSVSKQGNLSTMTSSRGTRFREGNPARQMLIIRRNWPLASSGNPSAMTSPEKARDSSVTVQWAVEEERPAGSVIGDLRQSLAQFIEPSRLAATSFQTLPRPNQVQPSTNCSINSCLPILAYLLTDLL